MAKLNTKKIVSAVLIGLVALSAVFAAPKNKIIHFDILNKKNRLVIQAFNYFIMKRAVKQVIFPSFSSFIKEMCKKIEKGKAFPLGSAVSVFATTLSPKGV